ncbi:tyrosine-type recombinase/integrase [Sabulicella rubraurantiaca]|uniref:tyrosine-type recombinase/integrase n=1 Tax=Sabulicella rubraurantiaca TaxID=2811429 RepID=UPI001A9581AF|nr:tyrosine-type recombinase/integrase [Sabulicella rubraurantiaca]
MPHRLLRRGLTWYVRYAVPKDRWRDVGRIEKAAGGERREIVRTLSTSDHRVAESRRDTAVAAIVSNLNRRLEHAGLAPLTDWKADWADRAESRRITLESARGFLTENELMAGYEEGETPRDRVLDDIREDATKLAHQVGAEAANAFFAAATGKSASVGVVADDWLADLEKRRTRPKALTGHRAALALLAAFLKERHHMPSLRATPFALVTPRVAAEFVDWRGSQPSSKRAGKTVSAAAIRRELSTFRGVWTRARTREETTLDPWREVSPPLPSRHADTEDDDATKRPYSLEELLAFFAAPLEAWAPSGKGYGTALRDAAALAVLTGCRMSEVAGLEVRDVSAGRDAFTIRRGKSANAAREVPLGETARMVLRARMAKLPNDAPPSSSLWPEVPSAEKGKLMSARFPAIRRRIMQDAGLDVPLHATDFHSFRRTFAQFGRDAMNEGGGEVTESLLGALMGHRERTLALRTYAPGVLQRHLERAVAAIEQQGIPAALREALRERYGGALVVEAPG